MIDRMKKYDVAIIGAGPSGMMAAIMAAKTQSVLLVEKNDLPGRKILATGNGRCNLTNRLAEKSRYHGGSKNSIEKVLKKFGPDEVMEYFLSLGVVLKEEDNGRIFPRTNQAQTIVDALIHKMREEKVELKTNSIVKKVNKINDGFEVVLSDQNILFAGKVIIAVGGEASPQLGSNGDGYYWAKLLGHKILPTHPALVPLETVDSWPKEITGLRVEGKTYVTCDDKIISESNGDILFTHFGLSAPSVMAHAGRIASQIDQKLFIHLDLFPDLQEKKLDEILTKMIDVSGKKELKNTLSGLVPNNLSPILLRLLNLAPEKKTAELNKTDRLRIVKLLKDIKLEIKQTRPFKEAQVTSGGVNLDEVSSDTLESKIVSGLYFAGEILDVDGDSGGFNLQWAWSSGHLAGMLLHI